MTHTQVNINSSSFRLDTPRTPATLATLIAAKCRRIEALEGWATPQTMEREKAELKELEGR